MLWMNPEPESAFLWCHMQSWDQLLLSRLNWKCWWGLLAAGKITISRSFTGADDSNHLYHQSEYPKDWCNTTRFSFCQSKISWICKKHFIIWQTQLEHELHCVFCASSAGSFIFVWHKSIEIINHSSLKSFWLLR